MLSTLYETLRTFVYFPVKLVVFMLLRACHSVPLFPAAVYGGQEGLSVSARRETAFCGVAQAAPPSQHNARGEKPPELARRGLRCTIAETRGRAGWVAALYIKMAHATSASSGSR